MYNSEHYISKLERNLNVLDKAPENIKSQCISNITWARDLIIRLEQLDYQEREQAIEEIHKVLDNDYQAMGFELPQENKNDKHL